jgi:isoleucyl-tRNA synthetase
MEYKDTINLPRTPFPMKANLPRKEPELLAHWEETNLYETIMASRASGPQFILHDGPPYANGHIHIGTALNKLLKDFIIKSKTMAGFQAPYIPGWDCHGLPIELNVEKKLGRDKKSVSTSEIRKKCRTYAMEFVDIQREEFKRLGVQADWDNPYLTLTPGYSATIVREFGKFAAAGDVYKSKKPIQWCASCRTALAEAEVEYQDDSTPSVYVKFALTAESLKKIPEPARNNTSVLIWTTTPWTLPANLAICLHPDLDYVAVQAGSDVLILAEGLLERTLQICGIEKHEILERFKGRDLEGLVCRHPLYDRDSQIILGEHVTLEAGTGCVHTAPGHGQEDYEVGLRYGLDIYAPVDDAGLFTEEVAELAGQFVFKANSGIIERLRETGALLQEQEITHSYPHCWRCKKPVIFRATEQWFVSMEKNNLRDRALNCVTQTTWIPSWGIDRIRGMIESRPDWCLSRQRSWGVPIVAFYCTDCNHLLLDQAVINHVADLFEKDGSDIWFERSPAELLPAGTRCPACNHDTFTPETDILDVWFDSGVSHASVLERRAELNSPADLYLEGSDQHRGWFQSSLLTCVGTRDRAPYRSVLTHGFVMDGKGQKMAKSKGNVIPPEKVIKQYGAEVLRLWVASENYQDDMRISDDILKRISEAYRKIRNTCRFMLGNLSDFNPATDRVPYADLEEIDQWALQRLNQLVRRVVGSYERYEFHTVFHSITNFCIVDLSAVYLDIIKDRLYCSASGDATRKKAQSTLHEILKALLKLVAPILAFTAEEAWQFLPGDKEKSVHLARFPEPITEYDNDELCTRWDTLLQVREQVLKQLELARERKEIGNSLEAHVTITAAGKTFELLKSQAAFLPDMLIVSYVDLIRDKNDAPTENEATVNTVIKRTDGSKCQRCWKYHHNAHPELCSRCAEAVRSLNA